MGWGGSGSPRRCETPAGSEAEGSSPQSGCAAGPAGHRRGRRGAVGSPTGFLPVFPGALPSRGEVLPRHRNWEKTA